MEYSSLLSTVINSLEIYVPIIVKSLSLFVFSFKIKSIFFLSEGE